MTKKFFELADKQELLRQLMNRLDSWNDRENQAKVSLLALAVNIIANNTALFDTNCQVNIEWIGDSLQAAMLRVIEKDAAMEHVDRLYGLVYRFVVELDLSREGDLSLELRRFLNYLVENEKEFTAEARRMAQYARQEMAVSIMKHLLGNTAIQNLRNLEKVSKEVNDRVDQWEGRIKYQMDAAGQLEESLKKYKEGFNFVGLYQGFDELSSTKKAELTGARKWLLLFGALAALPFAIELTLLYFNRDVIEQLKWVFIVSAIPAISLTLLAIYFFRITLRNIESVRAQLIQIELRKTLCRFIQSYAEYSKQLKENNIDALGKFENIIFSGLVSSDEKLPSTFDGLEQVATLVKAIRGQN